MAPSALGRRSSSCVTAGEDVTPAKRQKRLPAKDDTMQSGRKSSKKRRRVDVTATASAIDAAEAAAPGGGPSPTAKRRATNVATKGEKKTPAKVPKPPPKTARKSRKKKMKFNEGHSFRRSISAPPTNRRRNLSKKSRDILEKRQKEADEKPLWPRRAWLFNAWHDEAFALVRVVLAKRGWSDLGTPCSPQNIYDLIDRAQCLKGHTLPRRCLWWVHEDDGRRLKLLPDESMKNARHCIATWMGTDAAVTKVALTQMNNMEDWYPTAFVLPAQRAKLKRMINASKKSYWITKPADDYAGKGMRVYESSQQEFKDIIQPSTGKAFVVQKYVPNSLLIGGFKFHFRMYAILTGVLDNFECWLYKGGTGLFSTQEYTNSLSTMGDNFDPYVHLTNWSINFTKGNKRLHRNKPVIGVGCEHPLGPTLKFIKAEYPKFDEDDFWRQMTDVVAKTMYKLAQWKNVKAHSAQNKAHPRFENFGLDLIIDSDFKIWLLEANTQVGLNPATKWFPDENCVDKDKVTCFKTGCDNCRGIRSPRHKENNKVMMEVIDATMNLMRMDTPLSKRVQKCLIPLHTVANKETMKHWKLAPKD